MSAPNTVEQFLNNPTKPREEKLVIAYHFCPNRLSRGMFSTIDALEHAAPQLREQLVELDPEGWGATIPTISVQRLSAAVDDFNAGRIKVAA